SMCTMQAPHWPAPQPNLVPVSFSSSRSTHKRRVLSGAATPTGLPLTVNLIAMMAPLCGAADGPEGWIGYRRGAEPCYSPRKIGVKCCGAVGRRTPCRGVIFLKRAQKNRHRAHPVPALLVETRTPRLLEPRRLSGLVDEVELQGVYV